MEFVKYTPFEKPSSEEALKKDFIEGFSPPSNDRAYAVFDKTRTRNGEDDFAGFVGFSAKEAKNKTIEIGCMLFPAYHRSHVASNAVGLLLLWSLDPPSLGGMGLRRVEWKAHSQNKASRGLAERMGFQCEGISRWERLFPAAAGELALSVEALEKRNGRKEEAPGRHTAIYSQVWDEWEENRPKVVAMMKRR